MNDRDLARGYGLLDDYGPALKRVDLHGDEYRLAFELSRWAAMWPAIEPLLTEEVNRQTAVTRSSLTLNGFARLNLTEAFSAFSILDREKTPQVVNRVKRAAQQVIGLDGSIDAEFVACGHYCMGRILNYNGKWEESLDSMKQARGAYNEASGIIAVIDLQIHRLYLRVPERHTSREADAVLMRAEKRLKPTGDILNKAYIHYLRGRSARHRGQYLQAVTHFREATRLYKKEADKIFKGPPHRRILHAMKGTAQALRLLALSHTGKEQGSFRKAARDILNEAREVCEQIGKVSLHTSCAIDLVRAYITFDEGNREDARKAAEAILDKCEGYSDPVLLSRIHLLLSKIAFSTALWSEAKLKVAEKESDLAVVFAEQGKNRRVKARAYITKGEIALQSTPGPGGNDRAAAYLTQATALVPEEHRDYLREEWEQLSAKIGAIPLPIKFEYRLADLFNQSIEPILDEIKGEIIRRTQHMYGSDKEIRLATGLGLAKVKKHATGEYKKKR